MPDLLRADHRLTSCCFCINIKTGCRIIGSLTTFACSLQLISACHELIELLERERRCMENVKETERTYFITCSHIKVDQFRLIIDFIIFVIGFNGSVLLLYGIKSKQPKLFLAWLIYCGMVIFKNFFSILIWHHNMTLLANIFKVILLSYFFRVVRSYHLKLFVEINGGCPVVAVAFPQEPGMRVFLPTQRPQTASDYIKDDPPPPYPGLPVVSSSVSIDSQPPPYSVVNPNYEGPPIPDESSASTTSQANDPQGLSLPLNSRSSLQQTASQSTLTESTPSLVEREPSLASFAESNQNGSLQAFPSLSHQEDTSESISQVELPQSSTGDQLQPVVQLENQSESNLSPENQSKVASQLEDQSPIASQSEDQESFKSVQSVSEDNISTAEASAKTE